MKQLVFLLSFFLFLSIDSNAQRGNYVELKNKSKNKTNKLRFDQVYVIKLKSKFINNISTRLVDEHRKNEYLKLELTNANLDTLFFEDSIIVPYSQIEWICNKDKSYMARVALIVIDYTTMFFMNSYFSNRNETGFAINYEIVLGILPLAIIMPATLANEYYITDNWIVNEVGAKDIFKRKNNAIQQKSIFDKY
ncbi:MAG: hypothetical protein EBZ58_05125 [Bacteroidetes bacterium]|jgi:hypothetical protein|nr:hypothetical protein [Bacteroidota bacterium]